MQIIVNGEPKSFKEGATISYVLSQMDIKSDIMAIAVNSTIAKNNTWDVYVLQDNDRVEILEFVGGG